jgi:hypothetical protein
MGPFPRVDDYALSRARVQGEGEHLGTIAEMYFGGCAHCPTCCD